MKCNGCGTTMMLDRAERDGHASTCWHRCPLCKKVRLVSSPDDTYQNRLTEPREAAFVDDNESPTFDPQEPMIYA